MKNAKYPENVGKLLDSSNKSYRDSKSKKSSLEINFTLTYAHLINGIVFLGHPVPYVDTHGTENYLSVFERSFNVFHEILV